MRSTKWRIPAPVPALAHPCASVAGFDERLWESMVEYVTVGVDGGMTVVFWDGTEMEGNITSANINSD